MLSLFFFEEIKNQNSLNVVTRFERDENPIPFASTVFTRMEINSEIGCSACCLTVWRWFRNKVTNYCFCSVPPRSSHSHVLIHWNENKTYYGPWLFVHLLLPLFCCSINKANLNHVKCTFEKTWNVSSDDVIRTTLRADAQMSNCLVHIFARRSTA